jgi:hypothetical protein
MRRSRGADDDERGADFIAFQDQALAAISDRLKQRPMILVFACLEPGEPKCHVTVLGSPQEVVSLGLSIVEVGMTTDPNVAPPS